MRASKQQAAPSRVPVHILAALALISGAARAQTAGADSVPESASALDAEAIKSRVVVTGSKVANRAPVLASLKPQTSTNYQIGTVHQSRNLSLDADLYYIDFNNKIASSGTGNDLVYYNQGGVVYQDVEAAATWYAGRGFSLHANGSINRAEAKDSGLQVAKAPRGTAALGLLYKDNGLYGSLLAKSTGSQYAKDGEPAAYRIGAYTTTDLTVGYRWNAVGTLVKNLRLQAGVSNLADRQDVASVSANSKGAAFDLYSFVPERSWNMSFSADF